MKTVAALLLASVLCTVVSAQQPRVESRMVAMQQAASSPSGASGSDQAINPAKEAAIRKLLDVVGTRNLMMQVMATMTSKMKPLVEASLPPGDYRAQLIELFFAKFQSQFTVERMLDISVPIYDKYLTLEDVEGLTRFYQTPLGKKAISVLPQIVQEAQAAGGQLGQELGRQAMLDVLEEHPELKKSLEQAAAARKSQ